MGRDLKPLSIHAVTQEQAAAVFAVAPRTVRGWTDAPRNADGTYSLPELFQWFIGDQSGLDLDSERARLASAQANRIEADIAQRSGQTMLVDDAARVYGEHIVRAKARFLQIHYATGNSACPTCRTAVTDACRTAVIEALADLSNGAAEAVDATAATNGLGMGGSEPHALERIERGTGPLAN